MMGSSDRPIYLWVESFGEGPRDVLLEVIEFDDRFSWEYGNPPVWYALRGDQRYRLDGDDAHHVHVCNKGWRWETKSTARFPEPPFLLTDDADLLPAYEGAVGLRPTEQAQGELLGKLVEGSGRFITPLSGTGWLGILIVTRDEPASDRGHLIAFSSTGAIPESACEGVIRPDIEEPFGTIVLLKRGPV